MDELAIKLNMDLPCEANVDLRGDGTVRSACATQDIGTGTYTILAQIVSAKIGVPLDRISVVLGDTSLPPGSLSGDSMATASVIPAVCAASDQAISTLLFTATQAANSPFAGKTFNELALTNGRVHEKSIDRRPLTIIVLQSLFLVGPSTLKSKDVWVEGSCAFRNPRSRHIHDGRTDAMRRGHNGYLLLKSRPPDTRQNENSTCRLT